MKNVVLFLQQYDNGCVLVKIPVQPIDNAMIMSVTIPLIIPHSFNVVQPNFVMNEIPPNPTYF